jgi:hypothetical protein
MRRAIPERARGQPPGRATEIGTGALWALAVGGLLAWREQHA